jgi:hypothetical protein
MEKIEPISEIAEDLRLEATEQAVTGEDHAADRLAAAIQESALFLQAALVNRPFFDWKTDLFSIKGISELKIFGALPLLWGFLTSSKVTLALSPTDDRQRQLDVVRRSLDKNSTDRNQIQLELLRKEILKKEAIKPSTKSSKVVARKTPSPEAATIAVASFDKSAPPVKMSRDMLSTLSISGRQL